ncbi:M56 family metallopeptidase [Paenibacillus camerounensis]|uniref:M56 family metallopeptidase n=1 Tax=Paenibacillus camerounensis TaxID=1243663 RepID=UPI0005A9E1D9|nr:M56 family metallopeptidase [Paenibacillus camerounensis]
MITEWFINVLNMSITAGYVAAAVLLVRVFLRRAPKIFSYLLWSAVGIRLVLPVSIPSDFSLLRLFQPHSQIGTGTGLMNFVTPGIGLQLQPAIDTGINRVSRLINTSLPGAVQTASVNPLQLILWTGSMIWLTGVAALLLYSIVSYVRITARVRTATLVKANIYESDQIAAPFVCGFIKPKIYVPAGMSSQELPYIILHEQTHIRRRDYLIKPFAFLLLILHWFNPFMWLAYALMGKDMEMSCDETVVRKLGSGIKGSYSTSLLTLATGKRGVPAGSPLAFGEGNVKSRIKNILTYRQPSPWITACTFVVITVILAVCIVNPKPEVSPVQQSYKGYNVEQLLKNRTPYVGAASKVGGIIGGLPVPEGLEAEGMELQTVAPPYGLTIKYDMQDSAGVTKNGAISGDAFYRNSIVLFSLIDNVDSITYILTDRMGTVTYPLIEDTNQNGSVTYSVTFEREQIGKQLEGDIRQYATDEAGLHQLIDRVEEMRSADY